MALNTKWDCSVCTYLNWSSTVKCTLCGCNRPAVTVPPKSTIAKMKQGTQASLILKTPPTLSLSTNSAVTSCEVPALSRSQWSCTECTYTNWSNASVCTLCSSPRIKLTTPQPITRTNVSRSESIFDYAGASESTPSLDPIRTKPVRHNRKASPPHEKRQSSSSKKWSCPTCTYGNWPRSMKCVMCLSPPSSDAIGGRDSEDDSSDSPSSPRILLHHSYDSPIVTRLTSSSGEDIRQIRNKFTILDWLFLDACRGVISHDLSAVKAYLKQGGERSRQLTQDDVLVLNEPSKYTIGTTLVHLAVR